MKLKWLNWVELPKLTNAVPVGPADLTLQQMKPSLSQQITFSITNAMHNEASKGFPPEGTGFGNITYENGDTYRGYFKDYKRHGKGIYRLVNGNTHDGSFQSNRRHGKGVWTVVGVGKWTGNWVRDTLQGQGQIRFDNGQRYVGNFQNWKAHGFGKWTWPNGQSYSGNFRHGKFAGHGTMVFADGAKYVGHWQQSKRNGYGTMTYANGHTYRGDWLNDRYHGQGRYISQDWWYEGGFINDLRQGFGTYQDKQLNYKGLWEQNRIHGRGTLTALKSETKWQTVWRNGNLNGKYNGKIVTRDEARFEGTFRALLPTLGKVVFANQDSYEGPFENGKFHGFGKYTFSEDGLVIQSEFVQDSCLLSVEETLRRLGISMNENDSPTLKNQPKRANEVTVAFADASTTRPAPALAPFLQQIAVGMVSGYMRVHTGRKFMTLARPILATIAQYKTGTGTGIIYYREDTKKIQPDLFLYVGRTINRANYRCRNQQCDTATHPLCASHGPNHLANKINSMGMAGFEKWKAQNPYEWQTIRATCGLLP